MALPIVAVMLYMVAIFGTAGYMALHHPAQLSSPELSQAAAANNSTAPVQHSNASSVAAARRFADITQPVNVVINTWLGAAALNRLVGSAL